MSLERIVCRNTLCIHLWQIGKEQEVNTWCTASVARARRTFRRKPIACRYETVRVRIVRRTVLYNSVLAPRSLNSNVHTYPYEIRIEINKPKQTLRHMHV